MYGCNNQSNMLFVTKRIAPPRACSLVDITDCRSSQTLICEDLNKRSISYPCLTSNNICQSDLTCSEDTRIISNNCISGAQVNCGNLKPTKNFFELRRIANHCGPNPEHNPRKMWFSFVFFKSRFIKQLIIKY